MVAGQNPDTTAPLSELISIQGAAEILMKTWPVIVDECRAVLGSELHYQAVIFHCLRQAGVPRSQIGMNVKQWVAQPVSPLFQSLDVAKQEAFRGGFETVPDVVLFSADINADWRRRNYENTLTHMLMAIEVKASERAGSRLRPGEVIADIEKLAAHREEVVSRGGNMRPVMMVIDTAPLDCEQMTDGAFELCKNKSKSLDVSFFYVSQRKNFHPELVRNGI